MSKNIISSIVVSICLSFGLFSYAQGVSYELKTVVIDAGHGGKDPGATVAGIREKDIVLKVALKAGELIKKAHPNVKVIYTRDKDVFVNLSERAGIANKNNADLFISIHANYFSNPAINGTETYLLGLHRTKENLELAKLENSVILLEDDYNTRYEGFDPNLAESYIMFELLQDEFLEQSRLFADRVENQFKAHSKRHSRGVKQAGFLVLRNTTMPSVLIELGYLSNASEREYMRSEKGTNELGESIAKAFSHYKNNLEGKTIAEAKSAVAGNQSPKPAETKKPDAIAPKQPSAVTYENNQAAVADTVVVAEISPADSAKLVVVMKNILPASSLKGTWFAVQILASSSILTINDKRFDSLGEIYYYEEGGLHKYFIGLSEKYTDVRSSLSQIRSRFNGAFPVAFQNGIKTDVQSALRKP